MARLGRPRTYILALLTGAASFASLGLAFSALWAAVSYIVRLLAFYVSSPAAAVVQQTSVSSRWRSLMAGAGNMAATIAQTVTAFGGGYVIAALGYRPLFLGAAVLVATGAMLFWVWFGRAGGIAAAPTPAAAVQ